MWYVKQIAALHLKLYEAEEKIKKLEREKEDLEVHIQHRDLLLYEHEGVIAKLQMQTGQADWNKAVNDSQIMAIEVKL